MIDKKKFNVNQLYAHYLETVQLDEAQMNPVQAQETKRAFMGGLGELLVLMGEEMTQMSDDEGARAILHIQEQISDFWQHED